MIVTKSVKNKHAVVLLLCLLFILTTESFGKDIQAYYASNYLSNAKRLEFKKTFPDKFKEEEQILQKCRKNAAYLIKEDSLSGNILKKRFEIADRLISYIKNCISRKDADGLIMARKGLRELGQLNYYFKEFISEDKQLRAMKKTEVSVMNFGAKGDGINDDGPAIRNAIAHAAKLEGRKIIRFPKGKYLIAGAAPDWNVRTSARDVISDIPGRRYVIPTRGAHINLVNLSNITLCGDDATTLVFGDYHRGGFMLLGCRNVNIRNFIVKHKELSFTQGEVLKIEVNTGSFIWEKDYGFSDPDNKRFVSSSRWIFAYNQTTGRLVKQAGSKRCRKLEKLADGSFRFTMRHPVKGLKKGQQVAMFARDNRSHSFALRLSEFCTFERVKITNSACSGFIMSNSNAINIINCIIVPETKNKLMSIPGDGVYVLDNLIGPFVSGCRFIKLGDDGFNVHTQAPYINKIDGNTIKMRTSNGYFSKGNLLNVISPYSGQVLAEGIVKDAQAITIHGKSGVKIEIKKMFPVKVQTKYLTTRHSYSNIFRDNSKMARKRQDNKEKKSAREADYLINADMTGTGTVLLNNTYLHCRNNGIRVRGTNVLIEGNVFDDIMYRAIYMNGELPWHELPGPHNILLKNNRINDTQTGIKIVYLCRSWIIPECYPFGGIIIDNNNIDGCSKKSIWISNTNGLVLKNNIIKDPNGKGGIDLGNNYKVLLNNNILNGKIFKGNIIK